MYLRGYAVRKYTTDMDTVSVDKPRTASATAAAARARAHEAARNAQRLRWALRVVAAALEQQIISVDAVHDAQDDIKEAS